MPDEENYNIHIEAMIENAAKEAVKRSRSEIASRNKKAGNREENKVAKILGE